MSDQNINPEDRDDKGHGERSPSSLSVASVQSMKWDSTADFMGYSHHPIPTTSARAQVFPVNSEGDAFNERDSFGPPMPPHLSIFSSETADVPSRSPDSSSSVSQTKTYTLPGRSTATQSPAPSPSFASSPIPVERKDVGVSAIFSASMDNRSKSYKDFNQQCDLDSIMEKRNADRARAGGSYQKDLGRRGGAASSKTKRERKPLCENQSVDSVVEQSTESGAVMSGAFAGPPLAKSVSDASTDWEYGNKRFSWQTTGLTRSEVEYRNKKNSSSSAATDDLSLFKLSVTTCPDVRNENRPEKDKQRFDGSGRHRDLLKEVRDLDYKMRDVLKQLSDNMKIKRFGGAEASSSSGASTMCKNAREYAKSLQNYISKKRTNSAEILEDHIRTHLTRIKEQIRLVEKYNRALIARESKRRKSPNTRRTHERSRKSCVTSPSKARIPEARGYDQLGSRKREKVKYKYRDVSESSQSEGDSYKDYKGYRKYASKNRAGEMQTIGRQRGDRTADSVSSDSEVPTQFPTAVLKTYERWTWPRDIQKEYVDPPERVVMKSSRGNYNQEDREERRGHRSSRSKKMPGQGWEKNLRDRRAGPNTRDLGTITDQLQSLGLETQVSEPPKFSQPEPAKKSVAFFVPLFCDHCNEPVDAEASTNGTCSKCQEKFKWFCETRGEDGLYDVKGPQNIQVCFKEAAYSNAVVERNEKLLNSKYERMTEADKLCEGLIAKRFDRQQAEWYLRNSCRMNREEVQKMMNYLDEYSKERDSWGNQNPKKKVVIGLQEMRERTARLRANDHVILDRRRKEQQESRQKTNRIMQRIYASQVRKRNMKPEEPAVGFRRS